MSIYIRKLVVIAKDDTVVFYVRNKKAIKAVLEALIMAISKDLYIEILTLVDSNDNIVYKCENKRAVEGLRDATRIILTKD